MHNPVCRLLAWAGPALSCVQLPYTRLDVVLGTSTQTPGWAPVGVSLVYYWLWYKAGQTEAIPTEEATRVCACVHPKV